MYKPSAHKAKPPYGSDFLFLKTYLKKGADLTFFGIYGKLIVEVNQMRSLKICLVLLLVLILILSFGTACKDWLTGPSDNGDGDDKETCEYPLSPATGNVGDTIRSCHFEVTLDKAEYIDIEYRGPRVRVHATIKLVKSNGKGANIFTDCFTVKDSGNKEYLWDGLGDDMIPQVTLTEGQEVSGTTTITVAKNVSGFTAIFRESGMLGARSYQDEIKWKLSF